mmetsp:Transcript_134965/g.190821  ORF Transcript_134965/g.190821 Transcript_134965/m.190821 type:complete len:259 (-) Transcript_134965:228-1004(-)
MDKAPWRLHVEPVNPPLVECGSQFFHRRARFVLRNGWVVHSCQHVLESEVAWAFLAFAVDGVRALKGPCGCQVHTAGLDARLALGSQQAVETGKHGLYAAPGSFSWTLGVVGEEVRLVHDDHCVDSRVPVFALGKSQGEASFDDILDSLVAVELRAVVYAEVGINAGQDIETLLQGLVEEATVVGSRTESHRMVQADGVGTKLFNDAQVVSTTGAPLRLVALLHHVFARQLLLASVVCGARQRRVSDATQRPRNQRRR